MQDNGFSVSNQIEPLCLNQGLEKQLSGDPNEIESSELELLGFRGILVMNSRSVDLPGA